MSKHRRLVNVNNGRREIDSLFKCWHNILTNRLRKKNMFKLTTLSAGKHFLSLSLSLSPSSLFPSIYLLMFLSHYVLSNRFRLSVFYSVSFFSCKLKASFLHTHSSSQGSFSCLSISPILVPFSSLLSSFLIQSECLYLSLSFSFSFPPSLSLSHKQGKNKSL